MLPNSTYLPFNFYFSFKLLEIDLHAYSQWLSSLLSRLALIIQLQWFLEGIDELSSTLLFPNFSRKFQMADHPLLWYSLPPVHMILLSLSTSFTSPIHSSCAVWGFYLKHRSDPVIPLLQPVLGSASIFKMAHGVLLTCVASCLTASHPHHNP